MKAVLAFALVLVSVTSASAASAECTVTAVLDGTLPLVYGDQIILKDTTAQIGSTTLTNVTIVEQTNGSRRAVRVVQAGQTIEVLTDTLSNEGELYVTSPNSSTQVAMLICR